LLRRARGEVPHGLGGRYHGASDRSRASRAGHQRGTRSQ
jgi:hypothetical protein